jgi:hypothetical protein
MGIVHQPKPSEPKAPVPGQQPLQPGAVNTTVDSIPATRKNPQTPEIVKEELEEVEVLRHH